LICEGHAIERKLERIRIVEEREKGIEKHEKEKRERKRMKR
jgi:hypothetical protein